MKTDSPTLLPPAELAAPEGQRITPINILEAAVRGGVTAENVAVVKELVQMCRDQRAEEAKAAFAKAFFKLRKNMPEIHADKQGRNKANEVIYTYCSEQEIAKMLEPHLMNYGFAMLFGQTEHEGRITVSVTLMHESGHSEVRDFTVRSGTPNAMKDGAMCDAGGATTAWRHLMIKMFGLKSRIAENQGKFDAQIEGEVITQDRVQYLKELLAETKSDTQKFLGMAGVDAIEKITAGSYDVLVRALLMKRKA